MICTKVADFLDKIMRQNKESEAPNVSLIAPVSASPANFGSKPIKSCWSGSLLGGRFCEGFRMPALCRGLPSGRDGAGVRKPPRKETASRKGAYPPHALWGFESRQHLLASGRNDHQRRFRRIERSDGVFFAGHGMILFSAAVLGRVGRSIFGRAGAARSNDQRQKRAELRRRG